MIACRIQACELERFEFFFCEFMSLFLGRSVILPPTTTFLKRVSFVSNWMELNDLLYLCAEDRWGSMKRKKALIETRKNSLDYHMS